MNAANLITLTRMALIPVFLWLLVRYRDGGADALRLAALILFIVMALSDWLDGYVARKFQSVSRLGQILDPVADQLLVLGSLWILCFTPMPPDNRLPFFYGIVYIARNFLLLLLYLGLHAVVDEVRFLPGWAGKASTCLFFVCVGLALASVPRLMLMALVWVNTGLMACSFLIYLRDGYVQWKQRPSGGGRGSDSV
jgi:CDP-diacylglycerol--glycerol-3-phosphate 3-phosphatidyltransferase